MIVSHRGLSEVPFGALGSDSRVVVRVLVSVCEAQLFETSKHLRSCAT